jgi:hypothetical protein
MVSMITKEPVQTGSFDFHLNGFTASLDIIPARNRIICGAVLANSRQVIIRSGSSST